MRVATLEIDLRTGDVPANLRGVLEEVRAAAAAGATDLSVLRDQRNEARILRHKLDELTHQADSRLALPRIGSTSFPKPAGTDWSWRPQLWRGALPFKGLSAVESKTMLGDEVTVFHDCAISELTLRQLRNTREADLAPYGLRMDVFKFIERPVTQPYSYVFAGPPYPLPNIPELPDLVFRAALLAPGGLFVLEHNPHHDFTGDERCTEVRKYGKTIFSFFQT